MARILISCFSPVIDQGKPVLTCMYEGFIKALKDAGNQIMLVNTLSFLSRPWNGANALFPTLDGAKLAADIVSFNPEVAFAFNHSIPSPVLDILECPIVLWDSDSIQFYNDKDVIQKNIGRYHFFCFSRYGVENAIQFGVAKERAFFVPSATAVEAEKTDLKHNISFIGTMFQNNPSASKFIENYEVTERNQILALVKQGYAHINDDFIVQRRSRIEKYIPLADLFSLYSPSNRLSVVNNVADLGLGVYGPTHWLEMARFFPDIALAYRPGQVYSLKHNQDIYNGSKLCLNIGHAQVVDGYPWRVLDIMASNGCLLSDRSAGISTLLKGYVDLPMYDDAAGARLLAQRLLQDDGMRTDIVAASQKCIDDKARWHHRFADMEAILPIKFLMNGTQGSVCELDPKSYELPISRMVVGLGSAQNRRGMLRYLVNRSSILRRLVSHKAVRALITALQYR